MYITHSKFVMSRKRNGQLVAKFVNLFRMKLGITMLLYGSAMQKFLVLLSTRFGGLLQSYMRRDFQRQSSRQYNEPGWTS